MGFNQEKFMQETMSTHYYVNYLGKEIEITTREFDCMKCLAQGRTNKETAKLLGIATTTIENYQEALKNKFKVINRAALIDIYLASDLIVL